jgi:hypothetical protein
VLFIAMTSTLPARSDTVTGDQFTGTVPDPTHLGVYLTTVEGTLTPYTPADDFEQNALVSPTTDGTFTLTYTDLGGYPRTVTYPVRIDNSSRVMTVRILGQYRPVHSLQDIFRFLPAAPAPVPASLSVSLFYPITLTVAAVPMAAPMRYATDAAPPDDKVVVLSRGRPAGTADLTNAQADASIGAVLRAKITKTADPAWSYDCHGWTFTNGDKWINNDQVQKILDDNKYTIRVAGTVKVGDVAVYRKNGALVHTGVVVEVDGAGNAKTIESKWGGLGRYTHAPGDVPDSYGSADIYGSARAGGNLLQKKP